MSVVKTSISERSPLSPKSWPTDAFVWWQSLLFAVALFLTIIVPTFVFVIVLYGTHLVSRHDLETLSWPVVIVQLISYAFALVFLAALLPRIAHRSLANLGLRAPSAGDLAWGLGGAIVMIGFAALVSSFQEALFHVKADEVQVHWLRDARGSLVVGFVFLACIAAPFFEEFTFRGFVFNALLRYLPAWAAVLSSAIVFGLVHYQPGNAGALAPLAAGGVVLALVYYFSRSLVASMITHATFNACTVVVVLALHQT
jgi:membrane protease YdiL (CAAX protease family)